jgi:hypothetical protein
MSAKTRDNFGLFGRCQHECALLLFLGFLIVTLPKCLS